ncbi:MAG: carbon-nitrogen hydrolase family protein [Sedimentisphaerales bacterium]|nr:carbon-nitrogen hydrolase family protein [Sedimentisphaerales bacterium]
MVGPAGTLTIATCQFPVSGQIDRNLQWICRFIDQAAAQGAEVLQMPEAALTGYPGVDMPDMGSLDWTRLHRATRRVMDKAAGKGIWVLLGSAHRLSQVARPHNCVYIIGPDGTLKGRYDKRFCMPAELAHYTPGRHFEVFQINGVRCSTLICFDLRFPELYRQLYREGVRCVFQSCYNARQSGPSVHNHIMIQTMQAHAACNAFWISVANSSGYYSPYPSCLIQPDGQVVARLRRNRAGLLVRTIDINQQFYDPMRGIRELAIEGRLGNYPEQLDDPSSSDTTGL